MINSSKKIDLLTRLRRTLEYDYKMILVDDVYLLKNEVTGIITRGLCGIVNFSEDFTEPEKVILRGILRDWVEFSRILNDSNTVILINNESVMVRDGRLELIIRICELLEYEAFNPISYELHSNVVDLQDLNTLPGVRWSVENLYRICELLLVDKELTHELVKTTLKKSIHLLYNEERNR